MERRHANARSNRVEGSSLGGVGRVKSGSVVGGGVEEEDVVRLLVDDMVCCGCVGS